MILTITCQSGFSATNFLRILCPSSLKLHIQQTPDIREPSTQDFANTSIIFVVPNINVRAHYLVDTRIAHALFVQTRVFKPSVIHISCYKCSTNTIYFHASKKYAVVKNTDIWLVRESNVKYTSVVRVLTLPAIFSNTLISYLRGLFYIYLAHHLLIW